MEESLMTARYVIGIDFGTDTVRAVLTDTATGDELAADIFTYPRWAKGQYCDPAMQQFRQHPLDHLEGLKQTVCNTLARGPQGCAERVAAISVDTTGSTPAAVDREGRVLALRPDFAHNPNAMFILWKDHTAVAEAEEINRVCRTWGGTDFTRYIGGVYSSEWFYAKMLHTLRLDEAVRREAYTWVEHCDWIPAVLTGTTAPALLKRGVCAAGHKAMWHESWGGLPSDAFFQALDPLLTGLAQRLFDQTYTADQAAGGLTDNWARELGLPQGTPVGIGAFDAHMGAVGGGIKPYSMVRVIGTSTCDMLIAPPDEVGEKRIRGICGQVDGSIVPGMIGMEAGQSAYGDIYAWFRDLLLWPTRLLEQSGRIDPSGAEALAVEMGARLIPALNEAAAKIPIGESGICAVDWLNGRRTPDANQALKGGVTGLQLGSDAPRIFRALVEATAFGGKAIVNRFLAEGVPIKEVVAIGGVARKSPLAMQILADVLNMEIKVARSEHTVALGAAMFAAVVGGVFNDITQAQVAMGSGIETVYRPIPDNVDRYLPLWERYRKIGAFIETELT
jgi:L-ribulokinase